MFIYRVNKIDLAEGQISLLLFYYCKGNTIEDDDDSNIAGVLESPDITRVDKDTDEDPQYQYDTTYVDIQQDEHQDEQ